MYNITEETSRKLANMGIFCAFLVLFIHLPRVADAPICWFFSLGVGKIAVPFFFVASGYLLSVRLDEEDWYGKAVYKRLRTLCIPMIIWSFLYFLWMRLLLPVGMNLWSGRPVFDKILFEFNFETVAKVLAIHPFTQPFLSVTWFLRVLFILVLAAPVLRKMATPYVIAVVWVIHGMIHPDYGVPCTPVIFTFQEGAFSLFGLTYFLAGLYIGSREWRCPPSRWIGWICLLAGLLLILTRGEPSKSLLTRLITWLYTPILTLGIWILCPSKQLPDWLVKAAFPVYLIHKFVIALFCCFINEINSFTYVILGMVSFAVCVVASYGCHKVMPRFAAILFGGR